MKKIIILITSLLLLTQVVACSSTQQTPPLQLGDLSSNELLASYPTFSSPYNAFAVTSQEFTVIEQWGSDLRIDVFFGTWCHDSQREVPRLLKLLSQNKVVNVKLIALDYQKSDPQGLSKSKNVKYTPTIIVYKNNREVGRIIERPKVSLLDDINAFINDNSVR
jgi:thioredoxin 1